MSAAVTATTWPFAARLPTLEEQRLVRLCLCGNTREAEQIWNDLAPLRRRIASHSELRSPVRRLLPLLRHALKYHRIGLEDHLEAALSAATLWETFRTRRIEQIIVDVLTLLQPLTETPILLKGVSLAWRDYAKPWLRHCHDLDFLVSADVQNAAQALLLEAGAELEVGGEGQTTSRVLRWPGGLPIKLHSRLVGSSESGGGECLARSRATPALIAGRSILLLHPIDCAAQLAAALTAGIARDGVCWVPDLVVLLRSGDAVVRNHGVATAEAPPWSSMIRYVEDELGIKILNGTPL